MPCPSSLSAYAFYRAEVRPVLHIMEREERVKPKRACRPNNGDEGSEKGGKMRWKSNVLGRGAHYFSTYPTTATPRPGRSE